MTKRLDVHGYPNNMRGKRPREPLVHLLATDEYGGVGSITFHPSRAAAVVKAIPNAAKSATAGRRNRVTRVSLE
jgi:hypothetical protein